MSPAVVIRDARGRRECSEADFPLRLGAGARADICLPDLPAEPIVALIGLSDGHLFAQPGDGDLPILLNDEPLTGSRWLGAGDVLRVGEARVRVGKDGSALALVVRGGSDDTALVPPLDPPPRAAVAEPARLVQPPPPSTRRASPAIRYGILGAFAALVTAAAWVFLATSLVVEITPEPDSMSVDGMLPSIELGGHHLLVPGEYRVRASKAGYRALDSTVVVVRGTDARFSFTLEKLPGLVTIESRPLAGARVIIDGEPRGRTPLVDLALDAGPHEVTLALDRYRDATQIVDVTGLGERQRVSAELEPRWADLSVASSPPGARVVVDGEGVGRTPLGAEIMEGDHQLDIVLEGYETHSERVVAVAGEALSLGEIRLRPAAGIVALASVPSGVAVTVDGEYRGQTPLELSLSPHEPHELALSKAGFETLRHTLNVAPSASERLTLELTARLGTILIASVPADAELLVDGVRVGPATGRYELTAVRHTIEVRRDGYESYRTEVTPRPGVGKKLDVRLASAREPAPAAPAPETRTAAGQMLRLMTPTQPFVMGASRREPGQRANEALHEVRLTRAFYLGVDEVTNEAYRRFDPKHDSGAAAGKTLADPSQPVVQVSWEDAVRYLNWLSEQDSLPPAYERKGDSFALVMPPTTGYRLPTEAEWAFAARYAGNPGALKYPWGEGFPPAPGAGNYADAAGAGIVPDRVPGYDDGFAVSAPVGSFAANAAGIRDLGGNVSEWCHDYYSIPSVGRVALDPLGPSEGRHHVVRGASWRHAGVSELRLSYRDYSDKPRLDLGFRVARYAK